MNRKFDKKIIVNFFLSLSQSLVTHSLQYKKKTVCNVHKFCSSAVGNGLLQSTLI